MTYRLEGVDDFTMYVVGAPLIFRRIRENSSERIHIDLVETDFGPDDDKGSVDVHDDDEGVLLYTLMSVLDCHEDTDGHLHCDDGMAATSALTLDWTPKP